MRLQSAYWAPESKIPELLKSEPKDLTHEQLVLLTAELDRRFMQLWDKVGFENSLKEKK